MNFLEYLNNKEKRNAGYQILVEAFNDSELGKAKDLIKSLLKKQSGYTIMSMGVYNIDIDKSAMYSELFVARDGGNLQCVFTFNWRNTGKGSKEVYSISIFKNLDPFIIRVYKCVECGKWIIDILE